MKYLKTIGKYFDNYVTEEKNRCCDKLLSEIKLKYNIGKLIVDAQGWKYNSNYGNKLIKMWSKELIKKYGDYFSINNLKSMRRVYLELEDEYKNSNSLNFEIFLIDRVIIPEIKKNML